MKLPETAANSLLKRSNKALCFGLVEDSIQDLKIAQWGAVLACLWS